MASRKSFLTTISIAGSTLAATAIDPVSAAQPSSPSPAATAVARTMRRFDPTLTDHEIDAIARGLDEATTAAKALRKPTLANGDEPAPRFVVPAGAERA